MRDCAKRHTRFQHDSEGSLYEYLRDQCIFAAPTSQYERCGHYSVGLSVYYRLLFFLHWCLWNIYGHLVDIAELLGFISR